MAVVADGAGGMSGGGEAAEAVLDQVRRCVSQADALLVPALWQNLLERVAADLDEVGQTTGLVVATDGRVVVGASVGDSEAWLVGVDGLRDLTAAQQRKPLLGGGPIEARSFEAEMSLGDTLLLASDGVVKYASPPRIGGCLLGRSGSLDELPRALLELVRLPSGALCDDVAVVLVRASTATPHEAAGTGSSVT